MNSRLIRGPFTIGKMVMTPQADGSVRVDGDETVTLGIGSSVAGASAAGAPLPENAAAGALLGGGSGGYAGGGVGGAAPETAQTMQVADIAFVPGGVTVIPYPQGNQRRYRITGVVAGPGCFEFTVGASKPGIGRVSLVGAEIDSCPLDDSAIGTEKGVLVGGSILRAYGQSNHFSETFQVDQDKGAGYGPVLPTDQPTYLNVRFGTGVPSNITAEIAAHDRV